MFLLTAILAVAPLSLVPQQPFQPRTYASPSGAWTLLVDPSASDGSGTTRLVVKLQGLVQWTSDGHLSLREAVIDDVGRIAGLLERPEARMPTRVFLDQTGKVRSSDPTLEPRDFRRRAPAWSLLLQAERDLALFRVSDPESAPGDERWFVHRMSTGLQLESAYPARAFAKPAEHVRSLDCASIEGTPLVLVQWLLHSAASGKAETWGSEYALHDADWKVVWSLARPTELPELVGIDVEDSIVDRIDSARILDTTVQRRFELRLDTERVSFEVTRDAAAQSGWRVREVQRAPFATGTDVLPIRELEPLPSVALEMVPKADAGPIRDILAFRFEADDRIGFVRGESGSDVTLVTLAPDGSVASEMPVQTRKISESWRAWMAGPTSDWFCAVISHEAAVSSGLWRVDGESGAVQCVAALPMYGGQPRVDLLEDGGFTLLSSRGNRGPRVLERHAKDGSLLWSREGARDWTQSSFVDGLRDIASLHGGKLLALEQDRLLQLDPDGWLVSEVALAASEPRGSWFDEQLLVAGDDSIWLLARGSSRTCRHVGPDGKELSSFVPRTESGSTRIGLPSACDSRGNLWTSDGCQLFEFDEHGIARPRFGSAPAPERLTLFGTVCIDDAGRIAIQDDFTNSLHCFDISGKRRAICVPAPTDFDDGDFVRSVSARPDGGFLVVQGDEGSYVEFAANGKRTGGGSFGAGEVAVDRRTGERWMAEAAPSGLLHLRRFDAAGKLALDTERRRPDGGFFECVIGLDCAPDGGAVVLDCSGGLCFYDREGKPQREIALGVGDFWNTHGLHVGQKWIVTGNLAGGAVLVSLPDGACTRFDPRQAPLPDIDLWTYGLSPDEREIWAVEFDSPTIHRYLLPD